MKKNYATLWLGATILAFGLYNIHSQCSITEGGVLGMTLFLQHWFHISPGISGFLLDSICYILGFKMLGKTFLKYALIASASFSLSYNLLELSDPILPNLADYPVLASIIGGIFVGVGVGLVVRIGGASGGDDALALMISKITGWKLSASYFFTDFLVLMLSLTYIPLHKILCSLLTVSISSFIIGKIHNAKTLVA